MVLDCVFEGRKNNLFVTVLLDKKVLMVSTLGKYIDKKSKVKVKKRTEFGATNMGVKLGRELQRLGYYKFRIFMKGTWAKGEKNCYLGIVRSNMSVVNMSIILNTAHNGVRKKKMKRR